MDINRAALAIEAFVKKFTSTGATASEIQVRPSGDDVNVIKVWVDLADGATDPTGWAKKLEAAIVANVPEAKGWKLSVRAEVGA